MRRVVAAVAAALLLAGCGSAAAGTNDADTGFVAGDGSIVLLDAAARQPAPDLRGDTLDGQQFVLADHLGEVVVLNVWASWCAPCRAEAPTLQRVWTDVKGDGVLFVGLDTRDSVTAAQTFVERYGLTYPQVRDEDGRLQLLFRDTLPPQAIPSTVVVDREGRVAARLLGRVSESSLRGVIEPLLSEPAAGGGASVGASGESPGGSP